MTDFIAELEAELLAAARRRAARPRRRLRPPRSRRPALLAITATVVIVAAIGVGAALRAGAGPADDERAAPGTPPASGCAKWVTGELLSSVPSLRRPSGAPVPSAAPAAVDGVWTPIPERARLAAEADGTAFWTVPIMRLGEGERCAPAHDACLVPVDSSRPTEDAACTAGGPAGAPRVVPYHGRVLAYGLVDPSIREVEIAVDGGVGVVPVRDGVIASLLPSGVTMTPSSGVHWRPFGAGRPPVAVLNATRLDGLATGARDHLVAAGLAKSRDVLIANFPDIRRRSAVVYDGEAFAPRARSIAEALDVADVHPAPTRVLELAHGAAVVVLLGADAAP
jgi:LytR cell envelope-related transcriptional attenuator